MGLNVYDIWLDCLDRINQDENGYMDVPKYNRYAQMGSTRLLDWLTGDVAGVLPPEAMNTQKNRDWISYFITKYPKQVENGVVTKPSDYYLYQTGYKINGTILNDKCDEEESCDDSNEYTIVPNTSITLLDNSKFDLRVDTYIESLKPTVKNAVCKIVGNDFVFAPADLGSIAIEYVRYPTPAKLVMTDDLVFMDKVYDSAASIDFEWGEFARPLLVSFICQEYYNNTRDFQGFQMNQATKKLERG